MAQTVVGIFDSASDAQYAVQQLVSNGFSRDNIDVAAQGTTDTTSASTTSTSNDDSIGGFFRSLFGGNDESDRYSNVARRSSTVSVYTQSMTEAERVADILDQYGAVDVNERASQYGYGASTTTGTTSTAATTTDNTASLPIIEEELQVGKRVVETGGVRLRSRIIERPVEEVVRLRVEHVHVERNPVNRPATEADLANFQQGTMEVTEHAEVPVVAKEARVVEEVRLGKDVEEHTETVRETLRSTDVEVEKLNNSTTNTTNRTGLDDTFSRPANQ